MVYTINLLSNWQIENDADTPCGHLVKPKHWLQDRRCYSCCWCNISCEKIQCLDHQSRYKRSTLVARLHVDWIDGGRLCLGVRNLIKIHNLHIDVEFPNITFSHLDADLVLDDSTGFPSWCTVTDSVLVTWLRLPPGVPSHRYDTLPSAWLPVLRKSSPFALPGN